MDDLTPVSDLSCVKREVLDNLELKQALFTGKI